MMPSQRMDLTAWAPVGIVRFGRFPMRAQWRHHQFIHPTVALHLHDYEGAVAFPESRFVLQPGDFTLSPPGTPSSYTVSEEGYHYCVHYTVAAENTGRLCPVHLPVHQMDPGARGTLQWLIRAKQEGDPAQVACPLLKALIASMLTEPGTERRSASPRSEQAVAAAVRDIENELAVPPSSQQLAERHGLSYDYLTRRFKEMHGRSIPRFTLERRLQESAYLLRHSNLPIKEVALSLGFSDSQYFNKQFRHFFYCSPTTYRNG